MSRTLVLGDVHGAHFALSQVLERSGFDNEKDRLIFLGDVADGWPFVKDAVDILLGIRDLVAIRGNHDQWFEDYLRTGYAPIHWVTQGGRQTLDSYKHKGVPDEHIEFFRRMLPFYVDDKDRAYVHGGWDHTASPRIFPGWHVTDDLWWNRDMWWTALASKDTEEPLTEHPVVFIGHTAQDDGPIKARGIWNLDSGAGWSGRLTIMDADTEEYWQSDTVKNLYPGVIGRSG